MKRIAIFNPEHDMALANGDSHFIAPRNIREMGNDLAPLLEFVEGDNLLVWGWDYAIKNHLLRMGIAAERLPSDEALTTLRQRSGRASAHHLLTAFHAAHPTGSYAGESILVQNIEEVLPYAAQHGHIILKDPFSSSGKGLRHVKTHPNPPCEGGSTDIASSQVLPYREDLGGPVHSWANALIRRHGYLTAEPYYNKMQDFAMEFRADGDGCHFIGYSLFNTNTHGRYESNLLASDKRIESLLAQYIPIESLHRVQTWVVEHAAYIIPVEWDTTKHPLYFGIDMMIVKTTAHRQRSGKHSEFRLHPCIEINLRLNMGIVAHEVRRKLLFPDTEGTFHITAFPTTEALQTFQAEQLQQHPATYHEGRVVSGYHPLTPIHPETRHHAYIIAVK
jgi:hypothetical protein